MSLRHRRAYCTAPKVCPSTAREQMQRRIAALRSDDDRDRYLRERFQWDCHNRVLGERSNYRFLVARDEWDRTFAPLLLNEYHRLEYGGWPVEPDDSLSPGTIVFVSGGDG